MHLWHWCNSMCTYCTALSKTWSAQCLRKIMHSWSVWTIQFAGSAFFFSIKSLFHRGSLEGICCIGDGDTGYGNAVNVKRTVRGYAQAGMAGLWANGWWIQDGRIRGLTATSLMIPPDVYIWISINGHPRIAVHVVCYIMLLGLLCVQCRKIDWKKQGCTNHPVRYINIYSYCR